MRPPWTEATALLAAHGFAAAPPAKPDHPMTRSLRMADFAPFAFAERLDGVTKPRVFENATSLARHIERRRRIDQALELAEVEDIEIAGKPGLYTGVQVFTLLPDGSRDECLGWAWLDGKGRDRLEPALRAVRRAATEARVA